MAENTNYQSESSLPVITTVDEIDHFRIIDKNGQSQKATIAHVRELMGMDYSKLEEQIVPGEFWLDANGSKKQVYCKRIKISIGATTTKTSYGQIYLPGVTNIVHAYGNWSSGDNTFVIGQPNVNSDGVIVDTFRLNLTNDGQLWWMILTSIGMSITVNLFIKFIK